MNWINGLPSMKVNSKNIQYEGINKFILHISTTQSDVDNSNAIHYNSRNSKNHTSF